MVAEFGLISKFRPGLLGTGNESVSLGKRGVHTHRPGASGQHLIKLTFQANWANNTTEPTKHLFQMQTRSCVSRGSQFAARHLLKDEGNQGGEESKNLSFYAERPEEL